MKFLLPLAFAILMTACVTPKPPPKPGTAEHQQELYEQARANFLALKAEERKRNEAYAAAHPIARAEPPRRTEPSWRTEPPRRTQYRRNQEPEWLTDFVRRVEDFFEVEKPRPRARRRSDDTVYYRGVPRRPQSKSEHYRAAERQYAHELAKSPEDLSPEEREWAHRHY